MAFKFSEFKFIFNIQKLNLFYCEITMNIKGFNNFQKMCSFSRQLHNYRLQYKALFNINNYEIIT